MNIFLILISFAFPNIIEQTNKSTFCIKCHMMKSQYFSQIKRGIA
ncbi:MAG: NapC/NirT family cytochrome c [Thermodesulfobacterium sp.]|nr:NapC/NirT family cytochrome c [Thermodesulfobacterium sp.]